MSNNPPVVFLSYSSRDAVLARLIVNILEDNGVKCFLAERDIQIGRFFDSEIYQQIRQSNLVLVLWSSQSVSSPWVNQEVGIALGQDIPVWPIAIDDISIDGAIFRNQGLYLTRHEDPRAAIVKLAKEISSTNLPITTSFKPAIDQYLVGKELRTRELVELIHKESHRLNDSYTLRLQAAFSCFAISGDPAYRVGGYHTDEYITSLVQEMEAVKSMVQYCHLRAILWPRRPYDDRFIGVRFRNLVSFLENDRNYDKVRFVLGRYQNGNLYIFDRNILVEGIKAPESVTPGYELTTISYHGPTISEKISTFDRRFDELWDEHAKVCGVDPNTGTKSIRSYIISELKNLAGFQ